MDHTQKMFLVPQQQLDALKHTMPDQRQGSIRQSVENDLDRTMSEVLEKPDTDVYEKAKKYAGILQRYLNFVRQGEREKSVLTLSLPPGENHAGANPTASKEESGTYDMVPKKDLVLGSVIKHLPKKSKKHAECILDTLNSSNDVSWNERGELIINKQIIHGSHLHDLVRGVTATHNVLDSSRPKGWAVFLKTLADLNVPLSAIPNPVVRQIVAKNKMNDPNNFSTDEDTAHTSHKRSVDEYDTPFKTPKTSKGRSRRPVKPWVTF